MVSLSGVPGGGCRGQADITMPELSARFLHTYGVTAAPAALSRFLCRQGFTYRKP